MRIALLTIHYASSYGGNLQALASQQILSKYGDVTIVDYKTRCLVQTMRLFRISYDKKIVFRIAKDMLRILPRHRLIKKFKTFARTYFKLTAQCSNHTELNALESEFDCFVCGSDQIWNPKLLCGLDTAYFLDFVKQKPKIAFASSAGSYHYNSEEQDIVLRCLESFAAISVREEDTARFLSSALNGRSVTNVLDPTLMLTKGDWHRLLNITASSVQSQPYILVYTLKKDAVVRQVVNVVAKQLGLQVIAIDQDPYLGYHVDRHIMDACPREFIELISNATFIVTNSFHGTAFAINFGISFIAVKPESGTNRLLSLLTNLGLEDRLVLTNELVSELVSRPPDYTTANAILGNLRSATIDFLDEAFIRNK